MKSNSKREQRIDHAAEVYNRMELEHELDTALSVTNSVVIRGKVNALELNSDPIKDIVLENMTTADAIMKYKDEYLCVLNFASYKNPGGGFIDGGMAQEESLCHCSNLYNILSDEKFAEEYKTNKGKDMSNDYLYTNFAIYTPSVYFEHSNSRADVISCPAPNKKAYIDYMMSKSPRPSNRDITLITRTALIERTRFLLNAILKYTCPNVTLILGAWGCGVFGNNSGLVARTFKRLLDGGTYTFNFKKVIFAIPDDENFKSFKSVFENDTYDDYYYNIISEEGKWQS